MTEQEILERFTLRGKTATCADCGKESTLWFGFASPCRYNGGSHRQPFIEIDTDEEHEATKVWGAVHGCMWFDYKRFVESKSPLAIVAKELLKKYHQE